MIEEMHHAEPEDSDDSPQQESSAQPQRPQKPPSVGMAQQQTLSVDNVDDVKVMPTMNDVMACQFSVWYPIFSNLPNKYKKRSNVTIKSHIIKPLPEEFIQYLLSNNPKNDQRFILPHNTRTSSALLEANHHLDDNDAWSSSSSESDHDIDDDDDASKGNDDTTIEKASNEIKQQIYSFPELNEQIRIAMQSFREPVCIPKLNWSSPKDAIWINGNQNTMECRTAGDVYLLLKASDFITFDLLYARTDVLDADTDDTGRRHTTTPTTTSYSTSTTTSQPLAPTTTTKTSNEDDTARHDNSVQGDSDSEMSGNNFSFELVLRKFCNLYPSQEFRCFVSYNTILGISQRYQQYHFPFLTDCRKEYRTLIYDFYIHAVRPNVDRMSKTLQQYTLDLYIDQQQRIWIIDFNVWGTRTDGILFHWSELMALAAQAKTNPLPNRNQITSETFYDDREELIRRIDFRIVESSNDANDNPNCDHPQPQPQPIHPNPLSNYKAPLDALFLNNHYHGDADTTASTATTFQDFMKLCVRPSTIEDQASNDSSSSSDAEG